MAWGYSAAEVRAYKALLSESAIFDIDIRLLTLSGRYMTALRPVGIDGQINFLNEDINRTLQLGLFDPDHRLHLDSAAPTDGALGLNRLIQIRHGLYVPSLAKWIWVDAFTGRPSVVDRDGDSIVIEAQGKECRHLRGVPSATIPKGIPVVRAIREGLQAAGEVRTAIPSATVIKTKVGKNTPIGGPNPENQPWKVWKRLAASAGCQLYMDGSGIPTLRRIPQKPSFTWTEDTILSRIKVGNDLTTIRNRVVASGAKKVRAVANANGSNPFSAKNLASGGVPWSNTEFFDNPGLTTNAKAQVFANQKLRELLTEQIDVSFDAIPVYHVNPGDVCRVEHPDGAFDFVFREGAAPIMASPGEGEQEGFPMSIGTLKRVRRAAAGRIGAKR